jgi:hypothetical protein
MKSKSSVCENDLATSDFTYFEKMFLTMSDNQKQLFSEYLSFEDFEEDIYKPKWLLSKYESDVWECDLKAKNCLILNFNIELEDGSFLSDFKNSKLLNGIKYFLCTLASKRYNGGKALKHGTFKRKFNTALILVDGILSRAQKYKLAENRMSLFTQNDAIELLYDIYSQGGSSGAYSIINRVSSYLCDKSKLITDKQLLLSCSSYPAILWKPESRALTMSNEELNKSRLWLAENKFYRGANSSREYGSLITTKLYKDVFRNNLRLPVKTTSFDELRLTPNAYSFDTEFKAVSVAINESDSEKLSISSISNYISVFKLLSVSSPEHLLNIIDSSVFDVDVNDIVLIKSQATSVGRYRTLPLSLVFNSISNALEFYIKYSEGIFKIFESIAYERIELSRFSTTSSEFSSFILNNAPANLTEIGLSCYTISNTSNKTNINSDYFDKLRSNLGLVELYETLVGSVLVIIGAITARRQGEILDLDINCLSPNIEPNMEIGGFDEYSLFFDNRKSGDNVDRERISRPIPKIIAKIIWDIIMFKNNLKDNGIDFKNNNLLFSFAKFSIREQQVDVAKANVCLNVFCDYFETTTVKTNNSIKRFYIRQHQLRRFFAMTFFWGSGFDGLGTLSYFLGHTDPRHIYHYITESMPGEVLKGVQAQRILYGFSSNDIDNLERLKSILRSRFGVSDIEIRTISEVIDYLEDEVKDGHITTTPNIIDLKEKIESNIYQLLEEGTIELYPRYLKVKDKLGNSTNEVYLSLIVKKELSE